MPLMTRTTITPRDHEFAIDPARIADWNGGSSNSVFLNALSIMFPHGERFFIKSVSAFKNRIARASLRDDVRAFVTQEALHTREHVAYNRALQAIVDAEKLDAGVDAHLRWVWNTLPPLACLAATCALEHFTAILAREVLDDPKHLAGADPTYAALWTWHALEECEHKSVAFEVFEEVTQGTRYWLRVRVMVLATATFVRFTARHVCELMQAPGVGAGPKAWLRLLWNLFGSPGLVRSIAVPYLRYYAPGFRPDHIDDRVVLDRARSAVQAWA